MATSPKISPRLIAVIGGDGIGPEVMTQATRVLEYYRDARGLPLELWPLDLGAERYLRDGTTYPREVHERIAREASAVLLGALGDPRVPGLEHARDILFGLRFKLDLYANVRPVRALADRLVPLKGRTAKDVDLVVFRENTEGIYVGMGGQFKRGTRDEVAINEDVNTRKGVERLVRAGFEYARRHGKRRVHMADKSNAMRHAHELWYRVFFEVAKEYPTLEARHVYVDAMCLYLIQDPSQFEVVVTCNLFGDIVTDLGAALQGGLGMAASANLHPPLAPAGTSPAPCCDTPHEAPPVAMFEPVHGSAPPLAWKNQANPLASILTVGMLLSHLGWPEEEKRLESLVARAVTESQCTPDIGGTLGTRAVGDWLLGELARSF
ncbi:MAG TPA: isocitrate/isopropylmalate dehydrogenase family protein [Polyangiaceae bacterium]|nr:isocitrate/isopropylmalate dehydrogenase family protein [Polyangiaceae bacterium]